MTTKLPPEDQLLSRDDFRELVFVRDGHKCVNCGKPGQDAHHIIERRLFPDGGYYLANGATVCGECHLEAEYTTLSCQDLRDKAGISRIIIPPVFYDDAEYTKWGDIINPNGRRTRGILFEDESVQRALKAGGVLDLYDPHVKYPRTMHLPWSPGLTKDDRKLEDVSCFDGKEVVVTLKMDGENTTLYSNYIHARSVNGYDSHASHKWAKILQAKIGHDIPPGFRLCMENVYAKHSIMYKDLESYMYLFSMWTPENVCLSWDETKEYAALLDLTVVPEIYRGSFSQLAISQAFEPYRPEHEGYVVRITDSFHYKDFHRSLAKWVRANHVQPDDHHWKAKPITENLLKEKVS
jgi:hypothetical protein